MANAVTISGEATNACVFGLPSLRAAKLRLKEVMIEFLRLGSLLWRAHWPMHGPQALASTTPPILSKVARMPSRSAVYRTCSLPGVMVNSLFAFSFLSMACCASDALRVRSS